MGRSESCKHLGRRQGKLINTPNLFSQIYLVISEKQCLIKNTVMVVYQMDTGANWKTTDKTIWATK